MHQSQVSLLNFTSLKLLNEHAELNLPQRKQSENKNESCKTFWELKYKISLYILVRKKFLRYNKINYAVVLEIRIDVNEGYCRKYAYSHVKRGEKVKCQ